jgi:alpha-tubulin suppressor-like RCC1 family protein
MSEARINLPAKIFPTGNFETHEDLYGKGGFVVLNDSIGSSGADEFINQRVTYQRRKEGMLVYVSSNETYYRCVVTGSSESEGEWTKQYFVGRYFHGATAPTASDIQLGEKWFNTIVGSEFTYLPTDEDEDTFFWVDIDHLGQGETGFVRISGDVMTGALTTPFVTMTQGFTSFSGFIGTLTGTSSSFASLTASNGFIGTLTGTSSSFTSLTASNGFIGTLTGTSSSFTSLTASNGFIGVLTGTNASFTGLTTTNGFIGVLTGTNASFTGLTASEANFNVLNAKRGYRTSELPYFASNEFITKQHLDDNTTENNNLITNGNFLVWQRGKQFRYLADTRVRNQTKKQIGFNYYNVCHFYNYHIAPYTHIEGRFRREYYNYNRMFSAAADRWVFGWENSDLGVTYPDVSVTGSGFYVYRGFVNPDDKDYLNNSKYFCRISTSPPPSFSLNRSDSPSVYPNGLPTVENFLALSSIRNETNPTSGLTYGAIVSHLVSDDRPNELRSATADIRRVTDVQYVGTYFDPYNTCIPITGDTDVPGERAKIRDNYWAGFSQTISHEDFKNVNFGDPEALGQLYLKFYARSNVIGKYSITFTNGGPKTFGVEEYTKRGRLNTKTFYIDTPNQWKEYEIWCEKDYINSATGGATGGCWNYDSKSSADPGIQINWCLGSSPAIGAEEFKFTDIACGGHHTLAVKDDGTLWAWGRNNNGQLGIGNTADQGYPQQVGSDTGWTGVACGHNHSVAIKSNGTLWSWGFNGSGQLGLGNTTNYNTPQQIGSDTNWSKISCGSFFTVAIKTTGTMWSWGDGSAGQLGLGTFAVNQNSPQQIGGDTNWESVSCGSFFTVAIKTTGTMWSWGDGSAGQLGLGTFADNQNSPQQIGGDTNWSKVSCGGGHSIATKDTGTMWSWGNNVWGQLGIGTSGLGANEEAPVQIEFPEGGDIPNDEWVEPSCGANHSLATRQDGTLWSWGYNDLGQLGISSSVTQLNNPIIVGGTWTKVATKMDHAVGILSTNSSLASWGSNEYGQLGLGVFGQNVYSPQFLSLFSYGEANVTPGWRYPPDANFWGTNDQVNLSGATGNYFDIAEVSLVTTPRNKKIYFPNRDSEIISECKKYYTILGVGESSVSIKPTFYSQPVVGTDVIMAVSTNEKTLPGNNHTIRKLKYPEFYSTLLTPYLPIASQGITGYYSLYLAETAFTRIFHNSISFASANVFPDVGTRVVQSDIEGNRITFNDFDDISGISWDYEDEEAGSIADQVFGITAHTGSIFSEGTTTAYPSIPNYNLQRFGWDSGNDILNYFKYPYGHRGPATPVVTFMTSWLTNTYENTFVSSDWFARIEFSQKPGTNEMNLRSNVFIDSEYTYGD